MYSLSRTAVRNGRVAASSVRNSSTRHYSSTMHDNDPELLDIEKHRNLSQSQHKTSTPIKDAPGWNESLASASEASIKADRSSGTAEDLQRSTVDYVHSRHNPEDRLGPRESFERDEVSGPLSTKGYKNYLPHHIGRLVHSEERDEISGPLGGAKGVEDANEEHMYTGQRRRVKKTVVNDETVRGADVSGQL